MGFMNITKYVSTCCEFYVVWLKRLLFILQSISALIFIYLLNQSKNLFNCTRKLILIFIPVNHYHSDLFITLVLIDFLLSKNIF